MEVIGENIEKETDNNAHHKKRPLSPINGQPVPGGRPKGVPNKSTTQFKIALNNLFEMAAPQMIEWLDEIKDPQVRFDVLSKFAQYIYPKLASTTVSGDEENPLVNKIVIEHVSSQNSGSREVKVPLESEAL